MISRLLSGALMVAFGATTSQLPEYAQQYRQRLGGAVDELRMIVDRFDLDAKIEGLARDEALKRFLTNPDQLFQRRGLAMTETLARFDRLESQRRTLTGDMPVWRLVSLPAIADPAIARATLNDYEPALPLTGEGGILAGIGAFLGLLVARLIGWPKRALDRKLASRRAMRDEQAA